MPDYFVRKSVGSDSNSGLTKNQAWKSLARAYNTVCTGDTVYVGAGVYTSGAFADLIYIDGIGTPTDPISYIGDVDGSQTGDAGEVKVNYVQIWNAWAIIENFDFFDSYMTPPPVPSYWGTVVIENVIKDPNDCRAKFKKCKIAETTSITDQSAIFENCYMCYKEPAAKTPIGVSNNTDYHKDVTLTLKHCTIIQTNVREGNIYIGADDPTYLYLKNNLFINFNAFPTLDGSYGIVTIVGNAYITYSDYNHYEYYQAFISLGGGVYSELKHWQDLTGHDMHSTEGWAYLMSFTSFSDGYKLKDVSPCIGTGAGSVLYDDIEENVRDGSAPDKGCYEWQGEALGDIKTYFVRKSGNDANDGLSKGNAFLTLRAATDVVGQYETCYIGAGTYDEILYMPNSGDYSHYIGDLGGEYTGDEGEVHIEAMMNVADREPYWLPVAIHHVWLENLHFFYEYRDSDTNRGGVYCTYGHGHVFQKLRADKSIQMGQAYCSKVVNCVAWPDHLFLPSYAVNTFVIGVTSWIYHNTFIHNTGPGLSPGSNAAIGEYSIIKNNIFVSLSENTPALHTDIADVLIVDYNFYQYNPSIGANMHSHYATLAAWQAAEGHDENALEGDPLFEDDGYHIKFESPCVDMASSVLLSGMLTILNEDMEEEFRPFGESSDIGADEVKSFELPEENLYVKVPIANIIRFIAPDYANRR